MTTSKKRTSQRPSSPSASSGVLAILLSFFIGYAVAHVFDINFVSRQIAHLINDKPKKIQQAQVQVQANPTLPKPKFEYYSLLQKEGQPNRKGSHPNQKQSTIEVTQANPLMPIAEKQHIYTLQLASYFKKEDAERMKAELILEGHRASIEEYKTANRIVYRLMIGPFKRKTEAEKEQVDLARQLNVMGMIRRTQFS